MVLAMALHETKLRHAPKSVKNFSIAFLLLTLFVPSRCFAEEILIGPYSGKVGYFVQIGKDSQLTLDAILMNHETELKLSKLNFTKLGEVKKCDVEGMQQVIGYTIFRVKSCQ